IIYCYSKNIPNLHNMLYYILSHLVVRLDYLVPLKIIEESIYYILQYPRNIAPWEQVKKVQQDLIGQNEDFDERNDSILTLLKKLDINNINISEFLTIAEKNSL